MHLSHPRAKPSKVDFSLNPGLVMFSMFQKLTFISFVFQAKCGASVPQVGQLSTSASSIPHPAMMVTLISQFNPTTGELLHYVEDDSASVSFFFLKLFFNILFKFFQ